MDESRADRALARLDAALERIATARCNVDHRPSDPASSAQIMKLVNRHEALREEVADALGELDAVIASLEGSDPA
jgi:hypothetical protein